jgi:hypothetical protein
MFHVPLLFSGNLLLAFLFVIISVSGRWVWSQSNGSWRSGKEANTLFTLASTMYAVIKLRVQVSWWMYSIFYLNEYHLIRTFTRQVLKSNPEQFSPRWRSLNCCCDVEAGSQGKTRPFGWNKFPDGEVLYKGCNSLLQSTGTLAMPFVCHVQSICPFFASSYAFSHGSLRRTLYDWVECTASIMHNFKLISFYVNTWLWLCMDAFCQLAARGWVENWTMKYEVNPTSNFAIPGSLNM